MSAPAAEGAAVAAGERGRRLRFACGGEQFAIDAAWVREIVVLPEVTPLPFVPAWVAGVISHRGAIYTLVRFARLAGLGDAPAREVLLLRLPKMAVGLAVGRVEAIAAAPAESPAACPGGAAPAGSFLRPAKGELGQSLNLVDAEALVDLIDRLPDDGRDREA